MRQIQCSVVDAGKRGDAVFYHLVQIQIKCKDAKLGQIHIPNTAYGAGADKLGLSVHIFQHQKRVCALLEICSGMNFFLVFLCIRNGAFP